MVATWFIIRSKTPILELNFIFAALECQDTLNKLDQVEEEFYAYQYKTLMDSEKEIVLTQDDLDSGFPVKDRIELCSKSLPAIVEIEITSPLIMQVVKEEKVSLVGKIGTLGLKKICAQCYSS